VVVVAELPISTLPLLVVLVVAVLVTVVLLLLARRVHLGKVSRVVTARLALLHITAQAAVAVRVP
jgi:hypothetical protein